MKPSVHLDLIGAFLPFMRETDALAVARAQIVVDIRAGALEEAGSLLQAIAGGAIGCEAIPTELCGLLGGAGRRGDPGEIILFKPVGYTLEDLVVARRVVNSVA